MLEKKTLRVKRVRKTSGPQDEYSKHIRRTKNLLLRIFAGIGIISSIVSITYLTIGEKYFRHRKIQEYRQQIADKPVAGTHIKEGSILHVATTFLTAKNAHDLKDIVRNEAITLPRAKKYFLANKEFIQTWKLKGFQKNVKKCEKI